MNAFAPVLIFMCVVYLMAATVVTLMLVRDAWGDRLDDR